MIVSTGASTLDEVVREPGTKSSKIRKLAAAGHSRADIAKALGIRYQHVRNVLVALGNSEDSSAVSVVERRLGDDRPLVRGMAVWALGRLAPDALRRQADLADTEPDMEVAAEWRAALAGAPLGDDR